MNSVLVKFDDKPYIVFLVHNIEYKSLDQLLDIYCAWNGISNSRDRVTGHFIDTLDITDSSTGYAYKPFAKFNWEASK